MAGAPARPASKVGQSQGTHCVLLCLVALLATGYRSGTPQLWHFPRLRDEVCMIAAAVNASADGTTATDRDTRGSSPDQRC